MKFYGSLSWTEHYLPAKFELDRCSRFEFLEMRHTYYSYRFISSCIVFAIADSTCLLSFSVNVSKVAEIQSYSF